MKDKLTPKAAQQAGRKAMGQAIDKFDDFIRDTDKQAQQAGVAAAMAAPGAAVAAVGAANGIAGGAAIMKTLAIAGAAVGGTATAGIWVMGIGAVGTGWVAKEAYKKIRGENPGSLPPLSIPSSQSDKLQPVELWNGDKRVVSWAQTSDAVRAFDAWRRRTSSNENDWYRCNPEGEPPVIAQAASFESAQSFQEWLDQTFK